MAEHLDSPTLQRVLTKYAPDVDAAEDGVYIQRWMSTDTFYRHTEEYVAPDKRAAYKLELERTFPGKRGVL